LAKSAAAAAAQRFPFLAAHFREVYTRQMNKVIPGISPAAMRVLAEYDWPGNVRELENAIERAVVICREEEIQPAHLPFAPARPEEAMAGGSLEAIQLNHIRKVLEQADWNISRAAVLLQVDRVTLYNKIRKYNLQKP
jgi:DNA-binding NtrC family response regulator